MRTVRGRLWQGGVVVRRQARIGYAERFRESLGDQRAQRFP